MEIPIMSMDAAAIVLGLPELLESILLQLPTRDLLVLQRVARLWKITVEQSSVLRQTLFLEPVAYKTAWIVRNELYEDGIASCQSFKLGRKVVYQVPGDRVDEEQLKEQGKYSFKSMLNELVLKRGHWRPLSLEERAQQGEGVRLSRPKCSVLGSGLSMYLTQPPCCYLSLWLNWGRPIYVHKEEGIRLEDVLREIQGAPILPYLPHIFMQLQDVICLTDAEEDHVANGMEDKSPERNDSEHQRVDSTVTEAPARQQIEGRIYMWRNE